jgi:hydroxymethylpyrimidine pyrophosphatase-like HAD family hydrolase
MKTAVQALFSELEELHPNLFNVNTTEGKEFINHFHKFLSMEKEQIVKAYTDSLEFTPENISKGELYYYLNYLP